MKTNQNWLHSFLSLSILLGVATSPALGLQKSEPASGQDAQFHYIEQPILRLGMTLGGVAVLGILISGAFEIAQGESVVRKQDTSLDRQPVLSNSKESANGTHCATL